MHEGCDEVVTCTKGVDVHEEAVDVHEEVVDDAVDANENNVDNNEELELEDAGMPSTLVLLKQLLPLLLDQLRLCLLDLLELLGDLMNHSCHLVKMAW